MMQKHFLSRSGLQQAARMFAAALAAAAAATPAPCAAAVTVSTEKSVNDLISEGAWNQTLSEISFHQTTQPGQTTDSILAVLTFPASQPVYNFNATPGTANHRLAIGADCAGAFKLESGVKVTVSGNTTGAGVNGGALHLGGNSLFVVLGTASTGAELALSSNRAENGGGIYIANFTAQTLTFGPNARFTDNAAVNGSGGALFANASLELRNAGALVFAGNTAASQGGALFSRDTLTLGSNVVFDANTAVGAGGAARAENISGGHGLVFTGNSTGISGGALDAVVAVSLGNDAVFRDNSVSGQGDGGAINAPEITLGNNALFEANRAKNGGAIFVNNSAAAALALGSGAVFRGNEASDFGGGAIRAKNGLTVNAAGAVHFEGNNASSTANGGALYVSGALAVNAPAVFAGNTAGGAGGAILATGAVTLAADSAFTGNSTTNGGGAIYAGSDVTLGGNTVFGGAGAGEGNHANGNGGAIYITGTTLAAGAGATFTGNSAGTAGGAIYAAQSLNITGSGTLAFTANKADSSATGGGAIHAAAALNVDASAAFADNTADKGSGGAIYAKGSVALGAQTTFTGNTAGGGGFTNCHGGAIFLESGSLAVGAGTAFAGNNAIASGGAVRGKGALTVSGGGAISFTGNHAAAGDGGAVSADGALAFALGGGTADFSDNAAGGFGGALSARGALTVGGGGAAFSKNTAGAGGGAIYARDGGVTLGDGAAFTENKTLAGAGGAIAAEGAVTLGGGAAFTKNEAAADGGAIHATGGVTLGGGAAFTENKAAGGGGGAIHFGGSTLALGAAATFARNSAGGAAGGGAIYSANAASLIITHTGALAFTANKATGGGGGAIAAAGNVSIHGNTLFKNNDAASGGGGAIHAASIALNADAGDIYFTGNTSGGAPDAVALRGGASSLTGGAARAIVFDDPLHATPGASAITLTLNGSGGAALIQFAGSNTLNAPAATTGAVQLEGGSLRVLAGAVLDAGGSPFRAAAGASVLGAGAIASVSAEPIRIAGIIAPDARRYVPDSDLSKPGKLLGGDYATLTLDGHADLSGAEIRLQIQPPESGASDKLVVRGALTLDEGSVINVSGSTSGNNGSYNGPASVPLVETDGGVIGFPAATVNIPETLNSDDFLTVSAGLDGSGNNIVLKTTLAWYGTNPKFDPPPDMRAHGHFTLGEGRAFTVNVALNDHADNLSDAWLRESATDNPGGRVLTKFGAGTLHLAAAGNYSGGTRIEQGTLRLAAPGAAGTGAIAAAAGTSLVLDFTGTFSNVVKGLSNERVSGLGNVAVATGAAIAIPALAAGGGAGNAVNITAANFNNAGAVTGKSDGGADAEDTATAGRYVLATLGNAHGASLVANTITVSETLTNHGKITAAVIHGTAVNGAEGVHAGDPGAPVISVRDTIAGAIINRGKFYAATVNAPSAFDHSTPLVLNHGEFIAEAVSGGIRNTGVFTATTVNTPSTPLPDDMRLVTNTGAFTATTVNGTVLNGAPDAPAAANAAATFTADAIAGNVTNHGQFAAQSLTGNITNTGIYNRAAPDGGIYPGNALEGTTVRGLVDNHGDFTAGIINAPDAGLPEGRAALVQNTGTLAASVINGALINTGDASLGAVNGSVQNTGTITLRDTARWGALDNTGGTVRYEHAGHRLTVASLTAGASDAQRGTFVMDVSHFDLAASDLLHVEGNITGRHHFILHNTTEPETDLDKTPIVTAPRNVNLNDENVTGEMVTPLHEYAFMEDDNGGYMLAKTSIYGPGATVAANTVGAMSIEWFSQLHNIELRLGDLRLNAERIFPIHDNGLGVENDDEAALTAATTANPPRLHGRRPPHPLGIWTRAYGQRINADLGITGIKNFREYQYGADVGADREFAPNTRNLLYAGAFAGYQGATRDFRDRYGSRGSTDSGALGAYGAWLHNSGLYVEATLKAQYYLNEYDALNDRAEFDNLGLGLSFRLGYRWNLPARFYVEPDLAFAYAHIFGTDYATRNDLRVIVGDSDIRNFSANIRAGKLFDLGSFGLFQPYLRAGVEAQASDTDGVRFRNYNQFHFTPDTDGTRCHLGLGFAWQLDVRQQIHLDYQYAFGDKYTRPFALTLGYRRLF